MRNGSLTLHHIKEIAIADTVSAESIVYSGDGKPYTCPPYRITRITLTDNEGVDFDIDCFRV